MVIRNIIKIDEEKCNGCGHCIKACVEGALKIVNGKARLVSEVYCDGLGACIGSCPQDAITIEKREVPEFDEKATQEYLKKVDADKNNLPEQEFICPGLMSKTLTPDESEDGRMVDGGSQLRQWPVQLKLVSPNAPYFNNADFMLVADCVGFAMGDFHEKLLRGKAIAVACPKLDETGGYIEKLAEIIKANDLKSFSVVRMEVPCCGGLLRLAQMAVQQADSHLAVREVVISLDGKVKEG